jgi:hypothetical protein
VTKEASGPRFTNPVENTLYRALRDGGRAAGLSYAQVDQIARWVTENKATLGRMSPEQRMQNFAESMRSKGWREQHISTALRVDSIIAERGPEAMVRAPSAAEDRRMLAKAEKLLRTDPAKYWADKELQERAFEARERQAVHAEAQEKAEAGEMPPAASADQRRLDEIKSMLRDPAKAAEYWKEPALQAEHRALIERGMKAAEPVNYSTPASDGRRIAEIRAMIRTPEGVAQYRASEKMQTEFREALGRAADTGAMGAGGQGGGAGAAAPGGVGQGGSGDGGGAGAAV